MKNRVHVPVFIPARKKIDYLTFCLKYRTRLRGLTSEGKEFVYDLFIDCKTMYFDLQDGINYYFQCQAILEYSVQFIVKGSVGFIAY